MHWPLPYFFNGTENALIFGLTLLFLTLPIAAINFKFFRVGFTSLFHRAPNMDSLIALGSGAAIIYGIYALYKMAYAMGHKDMLLCTVGTPSSAGFRGFCLPFGTRLPSMKAASAAA